MYFTVLNKDNDDDDDDDDDVCVFVEGVGWGLRGGGCAPGKIWWSVGSTSLPY